MSFCIYCHDTSKCSYTPDCGTYAPVEHTPGGAEVCRECDARHLPKCVECGEPALHEMPEGCYCDDCATELVRFAMMKTGELPRVYDTVPCGAEEG